MSAIRKTTADSAEANGTRHDEPADGKFPADSLKHLAVSLRTQWKRYRKRLKRCQENFSERAVHESRVETRRLLSTVELIGAFIRDGRIKKAQRALKRHLDTFDDLRDTQVQLRYVRKMFRAYPAARLFHDYLLKWEDRYTTETRKRVKRIKTRRLGQIISSCKSEMRQERKRHTSEQSLVLLLRAVNRAFARVVELKERIDPDNTATIHRTRIAFKKFRYMVEALATLLPGVTEKRLAAMHQYQTLMGDIQDIEVLIATLDKFFKKKEVKAQSARHFRDELLRRCQWLVQRYLNTADTLHEFEPLTVPKSKPAATTKRGGQQ